MIIVNNVDQRERIRFEVALQAIEQRAIALKDFLVTDASPFLC